MSEKSNDVSRVEKNEKMAGEILSQMMVLYKKEPHQTMKRTIHTSVIFPQEGIQIKTKN